MGKLLDLEAFDGGQIVSALHIGHSNSEIDRLLEFSRSTVSRVYQEYVDGEQKASDRENCKEQLALTARGEKRLWRIVRSQRSQTLAQITTHLNDGASRTISKRTVQRSLHHMGFTRRRPTRVPLLNARHRTARLAWTREHIDWSVEDWKLVAWSDESRFRLLNANERHRIWRQAREAMVPAGQAGTVQGHGGAQSWSGMFFVALYGIFGPCTNLPHVNSVRRVAGRSPPSVHAFCYPHGNGAFQQDSCSSQVPVGYWLAG
ncbi:HTH_Tnp_Tc3_2 domain-containing protein [Trichonephila clavipes]|nr:HTH_Tnp_Tc3_2 domain-containing protein [Trichonephila clavipes]